MTDDSPSQPIRRARVTLNSVSRSIPGRTEATDDEGRFTFRDLPAGRFNVSATKSGFVMSNFGARRPDRPGTPIALLDGQRLDELVMRLARSGVITGTVRDQLGQPVPGVSVHVLRYGYSASTGERILTHQSPSSYATTDDRGIYRGWDLPPGDYVVMAMPPATGSGPSVPSLQEIRRLTTADVDRVLSGGSGRGAGPSHGADRSPGSPVTYEPIFHPDTRELALAAPVTIDVGEEHDGIDVTMSLLPTVRIDGVIRAPEGVQLGTVEVMLRTSGAQTPISGVQSMNTSSTTWLHADGRFAFLSVAPGHYALLAKTRPTSDRVIASGGSTPSSMYATADIVVQGQDLSVNLELQPAITMRGRIAFEGSAPPPQNVSGLRIVLMPRGSAGNLGAGPPGGQVDARGRFEFIDVMPGPYYPTFMASGTAIPAPWTLKRSTINGRDASDGIEIKPNEEVECVMTFGDQPTELSGTLQDASGRAAADYFVLVFPAEKTFWVPRSRRVANLRPASDGKFSLIGLPPGDYFIAALTDLAPGEWNNPTFLATLVTASMKVSLVEGHKTTQDLRLAGR